MCTIYTSTCPERVQVLSCRRSAKNSRKEPLKSHTLSICMLVSPSLITALLLVASFRHIPGLHYLIEMVMSFRHEFSS